MFKAFVFYNFSKLFLFSCGMRKTYVLKTHQELNCHFTKTYTCYIRKLEINT